MEYDPRGLLVSTKLLSFGPSETFNEFHRARSWATGKGHHIQWFGQVVVAGDMLCPRDVRRGRLNPPCSPVRGVYLVSKANSALDINSNDTEREPITMVMYVAHRTHWRTGNNAWP